MAFRVQFHPLARADLLGLYAHIAEESGSGRARTYLDRIERLCASLSEFPSRTVARDDLLPGLRTVAMDRRVLVALNASDDCVTILRVLYAGRSLAAEDVPAGSI